VELQNADKRETLFFRFDYYDYFVYNCLSFVSVLVSILSSRFPMKIMFVGRVEQFLVLSGPDSANSETSVCPAILIRSRTPGGHQIDSRTLSDLSIGSLRGP